MARFIYQFNQNFNNFWWESWMEWCKVVEDIHKLHLIRRYKDPKLLYSFSSITLSLFKKHHQKIILFHHVVCCTLRELYTSHIFCSIADNWLLLRHHKRVETNHSFYQSPKKQVAILTLGKVQTMPKAWCLLSTWLQYLRQGLKKKTSTSVSTSKPTNYDWT